MDSLKRRNSPFSPFSEKFDAEIRRPPYKGGEGSVFFFGGAFND